ADLSGRCETLIRIHHFRVDPRSPAMSFGSTAHTIARTWGTCGRPSPPDSSRSLDSSKTHRRRNIERLHDVEPFTGRHTRNSECKVRDGAAGTNRIPRADHGRCHRSRWDRAVVECRRGWRTVRWSAGA